MIGRLMALALLAAMAMPSVGVAATVEQKQATCDFGATEQKLAGAKRKAYMARCMSNKDSPRGKPVGAAKPRA